MLNIVFAGNVGGDVTLREVTVRDEQIKVASFSVAVDNGKNVDGEDIHPDLDSRERPAWCAGPCPHL